MARERIAVVIVAGGVGQRAIKSADDTKPKQYQPLLGRAVIAHTIDKFISHPLIDLIQPVISQEANDLYNQSISTITSEKLLTPTYGGKTRQESVFRGLKALDSCNIKKVLIHDAARPLISEETISALIHELEISHAAIIGAPIVDTIKKTSSANNLIETSIDRSLLVGAQTPQGFDFDLIHSLHQKYQNNELTDDASLCEQEGITVTIVKNETPNLKITKPEDFKIAEALMTTNYEFRTGQGYDVHAFEDGDAVILCGVKIAHDKKLKGHSDADVAMHALTDAIFGALAEGDIGSHFPPSDPQWKGAPSRVFLEKAAELVRNQQGHITHCDLTIICEEPKVNPHRNAMRIQLSDVLKLSINRISVKATTSEQLGFTGRREGIATMANVTIKIPETSISYE